MQTRNTLRRFGLDSYTIVTLALMIMSALVGVAAERIFDSTAAPKAAPLAAPVPAQAAPVEELVPAPSAIVDDNQANKGLTQEQSDLRRLRNGRSLLPSVAGDYATPGLPTARERYLILKEKQIEQAW
jgi:hypothetical protein